MSKREISFYNNDLKFELFKLKKIVSQHVDFKGTHISFEDVVRFLLKDYKKKEGLK